MGKPLQGLLERRDRILWGTYLRDHRGDPSRHKEEGADWRPGENRLLRQEMEDDGLRTHRAHILAVSVWLPDKDLLGLAFRDMIVSINVNDREFFKAPMDMLHAVAMHDLDAKLAQQFMERDDKNAALGVLATLAELSAGFDRRREYGEGLFGWYRFGKPAIAAQRMSIEVFVDAGGPLEVVLSENEHTAGWCSHIRCALLGVGAFSIPRGRAGKRVGPYR